MKLFNALLHDVRISEIRRGIERAETRDMKDYPRRVSGTLAKFCFPASLTYITKPVVSINSA